MNNDLISRSTMLAHMEDLPTWHDGNCLDREDVISSVENAPAVDAVEVVFCDNCTSHNNCVAEGAYRLARIEKPFCCAGKRRSDDAD